MLAKSYSVIIAPSDGRNSYHLHVSLRTLYALGTGLILLGAGLVFLVATYGGLMWKMRDWRDLKERLTRSENQQAHLDALEGEVDALREMDRRVRDLFGLPEPPTQSAIGPGASNGEITDVRPPGVPDVVLADAIMPSGEERLEIDNALETFQRNLPWPVDGFVSSRFGEERELGGIHSGIDIAAPRNTLIEAPLSGTVSSAGWHSQYGNVAIIDHGKGLTTVYCHNARLVVQTGDRVRGGDTIAFLGSTGQSTSAPHLHFEVRQDGYAVNPMLLLTPRTGS